MRKVTWVLIAASQFALLNGPSASAEENRHARVVESCLTCHRGPLGLQDRKAAELLEDLKAIAADPALHPVDFPKLSDEDVADIAKLLTQK